MPQPETANVTQDSVALLIFSHCYTGKLIAKHPERMLSETVSEKA